MTNPDRRATIKALLAGGLTVGGLATALKLGINPLDLPLGTSHAQSPPQDSTSASGAPLQLPSLSSPPANPTGGSLWYRSDLGRIHFLDGQTGLVRPLQSGILPFVTVASVGLRQGEMPNSGADFGPDTPGTATDGQAEADAYLVAQGGGAAVLTNNQVTIVQPSVGNTFLTARELVSGRSGSSSGLTDVTRVVLSAWGLSNTPLTGSLAAQYGPIAATVLNNGAKFGPDTPGTTTAGLQEAHAASNDVTIVS